MLKRLAIAALLTAGLHGQAARAGEVDMSTITCKELLSSSQEEVSYILMWIHGYYGGKSDDTTVDFDAYGQNASEIGKYCGEHPDIGVLSAVKQVLGE